MNILIQFDKEPFYFTKPVAIISADRLLSVKAAFDEMETAVKKGFYLAGFISYEAGYAFEERFLNQSYYDFPLICMGVYRAPQRGLPDRQNAPKRVSLTRMRLNISRACYDEAIARIRCLIAQGEVYQITYCIKLLFEVLGNPYDLYRTLFKEQPVPYPAYIEADAFQILSLSPEKFIEKRKNFIITKPMKGTWPRGRAFVKDSIERFCFSRDEKNRAENVMIADLLRNDLGRIGHTVHAPRLFEIAGYKTLFQMTSTVTAVLPDTISLFNIFSALFPSGSVTGAPKIRAMEVIRELEGEERRTYTGAIGYITPQKDFYFNIPIRSILVRSGFAEMGIGGGIVWDSTPEGEWQEGLLKARFVTDLFGRGWNPG